MLSDDAVEDGEWMARTLVLASHIIYIYIAILYIAIFHK